MPTLILQLWLLGLLSFGIAGAAIWLSREWYLRSWTFDPQTGRSLFDPNFGWNVETLLLISSLALLFVTFFGSSLVKAAFQAMKRSKSPAGEDPRRIRATPNEQQRIRRPDGTELHVELYGSPDAEPLVLSHGWGLDSTEWNYIKADLAHRFRLIIWDEPGLGRSGQPRNRDYGIEKIAGDLDAVLNLAGDRPAVLVGHSIGGMAILSFCRMFRDTLRGRVSGIILTHTTHTNPLRTTKGAPFYRAIEKPLIKPLMWLTIALSPIVRLMAWMSYRNGTAHLSTKRSSFAGTETWEELDFAAQFLPKATPSVLARGMLGMLRFEETETLTEISLPTLVVASDQDSTTVPQASERIHASIPNAKLITLKPARHLGLIEQREDYAAAVRAFAESLGHLEPSVKRSAA